MNQNNSENSDKPEDQNQAELGQSTSEPDVSEKPVSDTSDQSGIPSPSESSEPNNQTSVEKNAEAQPDSKSSESPKTPVPEKPKNDVPGARWYVVHTYSGHENKVATTLKQRIESEHLGDKIIEVLVPMQDKIEIKSGKKISVKEKIFPGYILVKMVLDDTSWLAVRTTQGVTSFVGMGNKPTPISDAEVATIVKFTQTEAPTYKQVFTVDDTVKIVDGPFAEFIGKIDSVDPEKGKVKVLVSIFGRETPVELDFLQVQKL